MEVHGRCDPCLHEHPGQVLRREQAPVPCTAAMVAQISVKNKFVTFRVSMCVGPLRPLAALDTYVFFCAFFTVFYPVYSSVFAGTTAMEY